MDFGSAWIGGDQRSRWHGFGLMGYVGRGSAGEYYSTKDPNNILSSQKHLSTQKKKKMLCTKIQNTHTHIRNTSNQFYIAKTS